MKLLATLAVAAALLASTGEPQAGGTLLTLPYDLESRGRVVYVADGLRHRILRFDLATRQVRVVAGTGRAGFSGDGGPAARARFDEVVGLAFDPAGNLYAADLGNGRVRRIARDGRVTTVARVPAAAAVAVSPDGRRLAIASLENRVHLLDLRTRRLTLLREADNPHGLAFDRAGHLLVAEQSGLRRVDPATGESEVLLRAEIFKVEVSPKGAVYVLSGSPTGGAVDRLLPAGRVVRVAGTGRLTPYRGVQRALAAGVLPTDLEVLADGTILLSQSRPEPAVRRLARGTLTTVLR